MKGSAALLLVPLLLISFTAFAADPAKIAVATEEQTPSSQVSAVAARSPYFLLFDENGTLLEAVVNPHKDAPGGVGSQAVEFFAGRGVTVVIAGAFGPKMVRAMQTEGMRYLEFKGSADEAVKKAIAK